MSEILEAFQSEKKKKNLMRQKEEKKDWINEVGNCLHFLKMMC